MHVLIDRENLVILAKHPDAFFLCALVVIEFPHLAIDIQPCDMPTFLGDYTDLELKLLYKHTTGTDQRFYGAGLRGVMMDQVSRMPEVQGTLEDADRQAALISEDNLIPHVYRPKAKRPAKRADLYQHFECDPLPSEASIAKLGLKASDHLYPEAKDREAQQMTTMLARAAAEAANPSTPAATRSRPVGPAGAPRAGGVREIVWRVADSMWEGAGKPCEKSAVLALRKEMMGALEFEHGVKRTSSSNELGNWQKARITL